MSTTTTTISSTGTSTSDPYNGKVLLAAVILLTVVVFFVILLHIYARWFLRRRPILAHDVIHHHILARFSVADVELGFESKGLDPIIIASLPMFVYKSERHGTDGVVDCVVCLGVIEEGESGRVLPQCKHVFHAGCIDKWLSSRSNCPICRSGVVADDGASVVVSVGEDELVVESDGRGLEVVSRAIEDDAASVTSTTSSHKSIDPSSSSSSSSVISTTSSHKSIDPSSLSSLSSASSLCTSLKRMVSKSRSESRVFPSVLVS